MDPASAERKRCCWATKSEAEARYHDEEWGRPTFDSTSLFELLVLEGAQAGLSWSTILAKRAGYRRAFAGFDVDAMRELRVDELLADAGIVRHRGKIEAALRNASVVRGLDVSFADYVWGFVERHNARAGDRTPLICRASPGAIAQSSNALSVVMSADMKRRGFGFVGPTTCYSFMQACGMVNDHEPECWAYADVVARYGGRPSGGDAEPQAAEPARKKGKTVRKRK